MNWTFSFPDNLTNGNHISDAALRDLERSRQFANANKSTLVIHSVQRVSVAAERPHCFRSRPF